MLKELLEEKILVLDGAMGTMIQKYNLTDADFQLSEYPNVNFKGNNDLLNITRPDVIEQIHIDYILAGADIIETNTFNANAISQADYNLSDLAYQLAYEGVKIAQKAILNSGVNNRKIFVAGAVGPTNKTLSISPDVNDPGYRAATYDELVTIYSEQIKAMVTAGVDIILIETIFDTLNAKAAIFAYKKVAQNIPLIISGTITDASGRTLSGQTVEAFLISIQHANPLCIGLNCALGADQLLPYIETIHTNTDCFVSVYPNAGLPNEMGAYDQSPAAMANAISPFIEKKLVNIIGGCCGTTPDHIAAISHLVHLKS